MSVAGAIRAGRAYVEIFVDGTKVIPGLKAIQAGILRTSTIFANAGKKSAAFGIGILTPLAAASKMAVGLGSEVQDFADRTGMSAEAVSTLGYATEQSGGSVDDLAMAVKKLQELQVKAASGDKASVKSLKSVGLAWKDLAALSPDEQIRRVADGFGQITNDAARTATAVDLFGKSGTRLVPLLRGGSAAIREMEAEARSLGVELTSQQINAADAVGDQWVLLNRVFKAAVFQVGAALLPEISALTKGLIRGIAATSQFIQQNKGWIVSAAKLGAVLLGVGAGLGVISKGLAIVAPAFGLMAKGISLSVSALKMMLSVSATLLPMLLTSVKTIAVAITGLLVKAVAALVTGVVTGFASMLTPMGMVTAVVTGLGVGILAVAGMAVYFSDVWRGVFDDMGTGWRQVKSDALEAWDGIRAALAAGDLSAAMAVVWAGIKLEWMRGTHYLEGKWADFRDFFLDVWHLASKGLADIWFQAIGGLQKGWIYLVTGMKAAWAESMAFMKNRVTELGAAIDIVGNGFAQALGMEDEETRKKKDQAAMDRVAAKKQTIEEERAAAVGAAKAERATAMGEVDKELKGRLDELKRMANEARKVRDDARGAERTAAEAELKQAMTNFKDAVAKAKAAGMAGTDEDGSRGLKGDLLEGGRRQIAQAGTFSAFAARGIAGGSVMDKIASASATTAKNTQKLVDMQGAAKISGGPNGWFF